MEKKMEFNLQGFNIDPEAAAEHHHVSYLEVPGDAIVQIYKEDEDVTTFISVDEWRKEYLAQKPTRPLPATILCHGPQGEFRAPVLDRSTQRFLGRSGVYYRGTLSGNFVSVPKECPYKTLPPLNGGFELEFIHRGINIPILYTRGTDGFMYIMNPGDVESRLTEK